MKTIYVVKNTNGFTLVELIVVMAIFVIVIAITGNAFNLIMKQSVQQSKSAESNIEGVIGLEIMHKDLASAGFGLPWTCSVSYTEAADTETFAIAYNDATATPVMPRAVSGGNNIPSADNTKLLVGTDYLVIRSTSVGYTQAAQNWTYMNYSGMVKPSPVLPKTWPKENLHDTDLVIVVSVNLSGNYSKDLVVSGTHLGTTFGTLNAANNFEPQQSKLTHYVYGVNSQDPNITSLRMPFNRADYYVRIPANTETVKIPNRCAPNTGILFKTLVSQADGTLAANELPLLDCVADMQVVYSLYSPLNGVVTDTDTLIDTTTLLPLTAADIRTQLKSIQVYVLTHEMGKDTSFVYPNQYIAVGPSADGINTGSGRKFDLSTLTPGLSDWQNYRWKVYRMLVNPTNINISTE